MRKRYDRIKWKVIHIVIELEKEMLQIASSKNNDISREVFFNKIVDMLAEKEYFPRLPISVMKQK
jgi:hypothetical protein